MLHILRVVDLHCVYAMLHVYKFHFQPFRGGKKHKVTAEIRLQLLIDMFPEYVLCACKTCLLYMHNVVRVCMYLSVICTTMYM